MLISMMGGHGAHPMLVFGNFDHGSQYPLIHGKLSAFPVNQVFGIGFQQIAKNDGPSHHIETVLIIFRIHGFDVYIPP